MVKQNKEQLALRRTKLATLQTSRLDALNSESAFKWEAEHRFHKVRKWRFDFAAPAQHLAIEVEGGAFVRGRHTRGVGFLADMEKYNTAQIMGWSIFRCTPDKFYALVKLLLDENII